MHFDAFFYFGIMVSRCRLIHNSIHVGLRLVQIVGLYDFDTEVRTIGIAD